MRIRWMFTSLLAGAAATAAAQSTSPRVGLFAGMNSAHVSGEGVSDISNRTAGAYGVHVVAPLGGGWGFQAGAMLSAKGFERDEPVTHDLNIAKLTYLELPLLLRYDIAPQERVGGFLFGGAGFGFRTGCSLSATQHSTGVTQTLTCTQLDSASQGSFKFASFDAGAIIGAGARITVGREQIILTAQYEHGLSKVSNTSDAKNRTLTFGAGIEIPVRRR